MRVDEWGKGLRVDLRIRLDGLLLAAAYAITCYAVRHVSIDQLFLPAGVRVAALLLFPPRLWAYLILGEYAYYAILRFPLIDDYGLAWFALASTYQMPVVALIVHLHRRLVVAGNEAWLLSLAALSSVVLGMTNILLMQLLWPPHLVEGTVAAVLKLSLGHYVAILTVAPLALMLSARAAPVAWSSWKRLPSAGALALLLILGYVSTRIPDADSSFKGGLQLLMTAPVIVLTCIHGWHGAAIGVPLLNLIVHLATPVTGLPGSFDAATFKTQQSLSVVFTALFALGAIAGHYRHRLDVSQQNQIKALSLAKASHLASEQELRARALRMRQIGENIDLSSSQMVDWLNGQGHRQFAGAVLRASTVSSRQFREQTSMVYPTSLEHVGLYLAIQIGGISQEWDATERVARPHFSGDPCELSTGLQLAAYRTIADAVSLLLEREKGQVQVRARCGGAQGLHGIVITVGVLDAGHMLAAKTVQMATERLASRTLTYGGKLQCCGNRVRVLMTEVPKGVAAESRSIDSPRRTSQRRASRS